jgi:uncharacterized protein Veg
MIQRKNENSKYVVIKKLYSEIFVLIQLDTHSKDQ